MFREGLLFVVSGPSGAGKGTLLKLLMEKSADTCLIISATTRKPRKDEIDGQNYFFKTVDEFKNMIDTGELIEWVEYCGNLYGKPKKHIDDSIKLGFNVILELEIEGTANIKGKYPDCTTIFVLPPSFDELKRRITGRGTEDMEVIEKRLEKAKNEIKHISSYDYIVINDDVDTAVENIRSILTAERLRFARSESMLARLGYMGMEENH